MQDAEAEKTFWREIAIMIGEDLAEMLGVMTSPGQSSAEWLAAQNSNEALITECDAKTEDEQVVERHCSNVWRGS